MHTPPAKAVSGNSDATKLRHDLCKAIASGIQQGAFGAQIRFIRHQEHFSDVRLYLYRDHDWHKQDDFAVNIADLSELFEQLQMIEGREFADLWHCRRTDHHDRVDFELKFHPEPMEAHRNADLESYLMGCLFSGHHDSGRDSRRRIRFQGR